MINITRAQSIPGWMDDPDLVWLAEQAGAHERILEVGSWMGRSTRALADHTSGSVTAVDTWKGSEEEEHVRTLEGKSEEWLQKEFFKNMSGLPASRIGAFRGSSLEAAKYYKHMGCVFDMIFVDAAHDYENVKADLLAWGPLVSKGGLFCGHDYSPNWPEVVRAVDEQFPNVKKSPGFIWYVEA